MNNVMNIIEDFKTPCACKKQHSTTVKYIEISHGLRFRTGEVLKQQGFCNTLLLVADKNTLNAASGIERNLLSFFKLEYLIYDDLRVATMDEVQKVEKLIANKEISVISVGTGSLNDICRLAAANQNKLLCLFGTAPSMDGFASYSAPIVKNGFKMSYPAKSPEVILADTEVLANAPSELKSAGFGDMIAKYTGLADWQISSLLTGEYYCPKIAALTQKAVDKLMTLADRVTVNDEGTAAQIFESLLLTGLGMSFAQNSRPASGSEHIIAHLIECIELRDNKIPNYHGEDVGVCTLEALKIYSGLAAKQSITATPDMPDWQKIFEVYGSMADEVKKLNFPVCCTDSITPQHLEQNWNKIRNIINGIPSYDECLAAMKKAGCKLTVKDIEKPQSLFDTCVEYSPYMRSRITLLRLKNMIK